MNQIMKIGRENNLDINIHSHQHFQCLQEPNDKTVVVFKVKYMQSIVMVVSWYTEKCPHQLESNHRNPISSANTWQSNNLHQCQGSYVYPTIWVLSSVQFYTSSWHLFLLLIYCGKRRCICLTNKI